MPGKFPSQGAESFSLGSWYHQGVLPLKITFLFVLVSASAFSLVISSADLQKKLNEADLVAEIEVLSLESKPDPQFHARFEARARILTRKVNSQMRATPPTVGDEIFVQGIGGEWGGLGVSISGYPRPHVGHQYLAHLKHRERNIFELTGFDRALEERAAMRAFSRNRTDGSNGEGSGPFLYWDATSFPIPFSISAPTFRGNAGFIPAIEASFAAWRAPEDVKLDFIAYGCSNETRNQNDGVNNIILITDRWPFDAAAIAITRNFYIAGNASRAGLILDSDILLNAINHGFTTTNESGKHDVQNIVTHEVGHFIGLGHEISPFDTDSTMFAVASPNETQKRQLHTTDLAGLRAAYKGVSPKVNNGSIRCQIPERSVSCLAVHQPIPSWETLLTGLALLVVYVVGTLALGRARYNRE